MSTYSPENAQIYSQLGILGTTYEVSFNEVGRLLGDLQGKIALDFGTGTGRSARFLQMLGAEKVIGLDQDENMITQAQSEHNEGIEFLLLKEKSIPLSSASVDVALSTHVLVEMHTVEEMQQAACELARVLKPGGTLFVVSTNPCSIGSDFKSYYYLPKAALKSGDPISCIIKGEKPFEIEDTYWTEEDYQQALTSAGFAKIQTSFPLAEGDSWLDEQRVAPDIVLVCTKSENISPAAPTEPGEKG